MFIREFLLDLCQQYHAHHFQRHVIQTGIQNPGTLHKILQRVFQTHGVMGD